MSEEIWVTKPSMPPMEEYIEEIKELWDTHRLTNMGVKHNQLEKELRHYLKVSQVSLMVNGHMALELALQALRLTGEVITTPFTFASTTHAIVRNGLTPVFCDIDPQTYTIDAEKIESLVTENTTAILPVHVYGNICDVNKIEEIARKYDLKVVYDAAHAFGEEYKGKGIGAFGDASIFSFHATKVFHTIEGGAVCFNDEEYGLDLYRLKNFGIRGQETVDFVGANAKMNEFQAAMGLCNLRYIEQDIARRERVCETYIDGLSDIKGIKLFRGQKDVKSNYAYFPVVINEEEFGRNRDEVFKSLMEEKIYTRKYFYPLTNAYDCYCQMFDASQTPIALDIARRILTLPVYADLALDTVKRICGIIRRLTR